MKEEPKSPDDILDEAAAYSSSFYDPAHPRKLVSIRAGIRPAEIFNPLGFKEIRYSELSLQLREALKMEKSEWPGKSVKLINGIEDSTVIIMANANQSIIYFIKEKEPGMFHWSRLKRTTNGKSYLLEPIWKHGSAARLIGITSDIEIKNAQNPQAFPYNKKAELRLRLAERDRGPDVVDAVQVTRENIKDITNMAA